MGLFHHDHDDPKTYTCNMPSSFDADAPEPFIGNLSFHHLNMAISGACAIFTTLSILILMIRHARHFSKPNEQSKILKISSLLPVYSVISFITISAPNTYIYLNPWLDVCQSIALGSFFLLLCEFVSPSTQFRDVFFAALEVPQSRKQSSRQVNGLEWYRKRWIAVFQYPVVALGIAVATDILQGVGRYCWNSSSIHFAHLWCSIIINVSIFFAVFSVWMFYVALKKDLRHHKPLAKFLAFKLVIAFTFIQRIVFQILRSTGALKESPTLTWADVNFGIQSMIIAVEMVPFSIFFHFAYDAGAYNLTKPRPLPISEIGGASTSSDEEQNVVHRVDQYRKERHHPQQQHFSVPSERAQSQTQGYFGGPLGVNAWISLLNPLEILRAIAFAFRMKSESRGRTRQVAGVAPPSYPST